MSNQFESPSITIDMTPPIRRVGSSSIPSDDIYLNQQIHINTKFSRPILSMKKKKENSLNLIKQSIQKSNIDPPSILRERSNSSSSSSSSSSKSSNNDSLRSITQNPSLHHNDNDDDASSNDDTNQQWDLEQLPQHLPLRQLLSRDSFSLSSDNHPTVSIPIRECKVCLEESSIEPLICCSSSICSKCVYTHLSSHIVEARIRVRCPSCPHIFTREQILSLISSNDSNGEMGERYKRFYADINREAHIKTCPRCCSIKEIDKGLYEGIRWKRNIPRQVICNECQFEWCFYCHSPWHDKMTCKEYQQGEKMLRSWAQQIDQDQHNAQKCPRCKVYISRNGGCPHMVCSKCSCDFCYNCGKRRVGLKFFGSHESRFSPLGCKYNLYPDKPILRHTVRGLVAGAVTLAIPVAAVGAVALLAVGTTIGAPTYGTYRLVKHIRSKRQARRRRRDMTAISSEWTNESLSTYANGADERNIEDDDINRAIQASLETHREETARREQREVTPYPMRRLTFFNQNNIDDDDDDDDDDSLDE